MKVECISPYANARWASMISYNGEVESAHKTLRKYSDSDDTIWGNDLKNRCNCVDSNRAQEAMCVKAGENQLKRYRIESRAFIL